MSDAPTVERMHALKVALEHEVARLRKELKEAEEQLERLTVTCEVLDGWPDSMPSFEKFGFEKRVPVRDMLMDVMRSLPNHGLKSEDVRATAEERFNRSISRSASRTALGRMRAQGLLDLRHRRWYVVDRHQAQ